MTKHIFKCPKNTLKIHYSSSSWMIEEQQIIIIIRIIRRNISQKIPSISLSILHIYFFATTSTLNISDVRYKLIWFLKKNFCLLSTQDTYPNQN